MANCDDQTNLEFTAEENQALRRYMELGGFVYLDAGIVPFPGADLGHSYAAWEERPEVKEWFGQYFQKRHSYLLTEVTIFSEFSSKDFRKCRS